MIARGDFEEREYIVLEADDPAGGAGRNRWQEGIDAWIGGQDDGRYKYPKEYCGESDEIVVEIISPGDEEKVDNDFEFRAKVTGNHDIKEVKFYVDGVEVKKITDKPYRFNKFLNDGTYILKVRAEDVKGNAADKEIRIGVNLEWDWQPSPLPSPSPSPASSPSSP
jgi:hypothetical protein